MQRSLNKALAKWWKLLSRQLFFFYDGVWWWNLDWYPYWIIRDNGDLWFQDDAKLDFKYHFQPKIDKKLEYTYSGMLISGALKQISSFIFCDLLN